MVLRPPSALDTRPSIGQLIPITEDEPKNVPDTIREAGQRCGGRSPVRRRSIGGKGFPSSETSDE
jgi:hypothetical protein